MENGNNKFFQEAKDVAKLSTFYKCHTGCVVVYKNSIISLINDSNIDFSKFGWVEKAKLYLENNFGILLKGNVSRFIKKYYPEFFENNNIFIRK